MSHPESAETFVPPGESSHRNQQERIGKITRELAAARAELEVMVDRRNDNRDPLAYQIGKKIVSLEAELRKLGVDPSVADPQPAEPEELLPGAITEAHAELEKTRGEEYGHDVAEQATRRDAVDPADTAAYEDPHR